MNLKVESIVIGLLTCFVNDINKQAPINIIEYSYIVPAMILYSISGVQCHLATIST